jgi:ribosomal protein S18 acetylase RimI-like enzyme
MIVRFASINDISTLIRVRFDYFDTEGWILADDKMAMIRAQLQQYYQEHLNRDFFAAFAENNEKAIASVAFLVISENPANLSWPTGKTGMMLNVLTYPEFRRKGYATQVLKLLIDKAKEKNLSFIELSASELGKSLYKKLGFRIIEASHFTEMKLPLLDS